MKITTGIFKLRSRYGKPCIYFIIAYKFIWRLIAKVYKIYLRHTSKVCDDIIIFESEPDYADNARALCEYMQDNPHYANKRLYFVVSDVKRCSALFQDKKVIFIGVNQFLEYPLATLRIMYKAGWWLSSHSFSLSKEEKAAGQKYIRLWHGCGYKDKIDVDKNGGRLFDKVCVPGPLFIPVKARYWDIAEDRIIARGYPRFDWLRMKSGKAQALYKRFIGNNSKGIIWMPTYRNTATTIHKDMEVTSKFPLISNDLEWSELDRHCSSLKIVLLIKLHIYQVSFNIDFSKFSNIKIVTNNDFDEAGVPMYDFIGLTDALISDYSSIAVDYLVVDKPLAFALDDFEEYKQNRGFVFEDPRIYMPGHHLYGFADLLSFMKDVANGNDKYRKQRLEMMTKAIVPSCNYCQKLLDYLNI